MTAYGTTQTAIDWGFGVSNSSGLSDTWLTWFRWSWRRVIIEA